MIGFLLFLALASLTTMFVAAAVMLVCMVIVFIKEELL